MFPVFAAKLGFPRAHGTAGYEHRALPQFSEQVKKAYEMFLQAFERYNSTAVVSSQNSAQTQQPSVRAPEAHAEPQQTQADNAQAWNRLVRSNITPVTMRQEGFSESFILEVATARRQIGLGAKSVQPNAMQSAQQLVQGTPGAVSVAPPKQIIDQTSSSVSNGASVLQTSGDMPAVSSNQMVQTQQIAQARFSRKDMQIAKEAVKQLKDDLAKEIGSLLDLLLHLRPYVAHFCFL